MCSFSLTQCVVTACIQCNQPYRTYVPGTICKLPDGGLVFYREPHVLCPLCDPEGYGTFMNGDLLPDLQPLPSAPATSGEEINEPTITPFPII